MLKIAFDIGGVLSKFPDEFRRLFHALRASRDVRVVVISDMKPHAKAVAMCRDNGFNVDPADVYCADYQRLGESCKALLCNELGIDILIDDHMAYLTVQGLPLVRLLVMPDTTRDYYHHSWRTDGSEGNFGRRRNPPESKRPPMDLDPQAGE